MAIADAQDRRRPGPRLHGRKPVFCFVFFLVFFSVCLFSRNTLPSAQRYSVNSIGNCCLNYVPPPII